MNIYINMKNGSIWLESEFTIVIKLRKCFIRRLLNEMGLFYAIKIFCDWFYKVVLFNQNTLSQFCWFYFLIIIKYVLLWISFTFFSAVLHISPFTFKRTLIFIRCYLRTFFFINSHIFMTLHHLSTTHLFSVF